MYDQERDRPHELTRQRAALGQFGELSLKSDNLDEILTEACGLVSNALGTDLAKVLACQENGTELLVRAGVGWKPGTVGQTTIPTGHFSAAGHALHTGQPVLSNDMEQESRFELPDVMREHGVKAMVNVIILGPDGKPPYGVLEVDSRVPRAFSADDTDFLRSYANLLASAVERFRITSELRRRAEEKERLLHELQHRVKNNLQVITSLVRLQASRSRHPEVERELTAIGHRVETLRLVHDHLHAIGGVDQVDLGNYLAVLASTLLEFHGEQGSAVRLVTELEPVVVSSSAAVPLGVISTEFITNSFKYAFGDASGTIGVRLEAMADKVRLTLWDDGKGLPEDRQAGTGMQLVAGFARQLHADVDWTSHGGTRLSLTFPVSTPGS
jgi:two-component sensor histidine kinase/putative methionine-R-sulfoxide reductase with GAF domain